MLRLWRWGGEARIDHQAGILALLDFVSKYHDDHLDSFASAEKSLIEVAMASVAKAVKWLGGA